jgi:hypothetical protein
VKNVTKKTEKRIQNTLSIQTTVATSGNETGVGGDAKRTLL